MRWSTADEFMNANRLSGVIQVNVLYDINGIGIIGAAYSLENEKRFNLKKEEMSKLRDQYPIWLFH